MSSRGRLAGILLVLLGIALAGHAAPPFRPDAAAIRNGRMGEFPAGWTFRASPSSPAVVVDASLPRGGIPAGWRGYGSFSTRFDVPPTLVGTPLALVVRTPGTARVMLDGVPLATRGAQAKGWMRNAAIPVRFDRAGAHELTIDFANPLAPHLERVGRTSGFTVSIALPETVELVAAARTKAAAFVVWFFTGLLISFGILHVCLWLFQREAVNNLWFAALCFATASLDFFLFYKELTSNQQFMIVSEVVMNVSGVLWGLFLARFVHGVFPRRESRIAFRVAAAACAVIAAISLVHTSAILPLVFLFMLLSCVEAVRVVIAAWVERRPGARIVGFGILILGAGFGAALLRNLDIIPREAIGSWMPFGAMVALVGSMSLFLSLEFARTNRELRRQLAEVARLSEEKLEQERRAQKEETERKLLEAEYRRKSEELEEARALQLSMLPRSLPRHEALEVAAWISTATEVGGDYYDFAEDGGTLLLGIGDATGHGMRAGTMVTATKALFGVFGRSELAREMAESNRALRRMNLRRLAMAFTLARFDRSHVRISSGGMPPVHVRRADGSVEAIDVPGIPLGSMERSRYAEVEIPMSAGDAFVFMSDGFPELLSADGEMIGYDRVAEVIRASASTTAEGLLQELISFTARWKGERPQDDDITFVVVRAADGQTARGLVSD